MKTKLMKLLLVGLIICIFANTNINALTSKHGEVWQELSDGNKRMYIAAMVSGMDYVLVKILPIIEAKTYEGLFTQKEGKEIQEIIEFRIKLSEIKEDDVVDVVKDITNIMTDIYEDPANTYIPIYEILRIAYKKIKGENIEPLLQEERKKVW